MIAEGLEESLTLDYKRADSLAGKDDKKKIEITKDVSSFANSAGGIIIYGVAEYKEEVRRHLPERLDPIKRTDVSKEWLDQIIQSIQPRIDGLTIHPVTISVADNTVCYVVEVPQSHTAHMARDHRYHKRQNFTTAQMEDYEVRDIMNRRTHPKVKASIFINKKTNRSKPEGTILVRLDNVGRILAHHVMIELEIPIDLDGLIGVEDPVIMENDDDGDFFLTRISFGGMSGPVFPGSSITLRRKIHTDAQIKHLDGRPLRSRKYMKVSVFADEAPPIHALLDIAPVLAGWTPIETKEPSK